MFLNKVHFKKLLKSAKNAESKVDFIHKMKISVKEADELVVKADKAMYKSKRAGRNQVSIWREDAE